MPTKTLKTCQVAIRRGLDTITTEVLRHEVPILKAIHLPENVTPAGDRIGTREVEDSAEAEYQRLFSKYPLPHHGAIRALYPSAEELAAKTGLRLGEAGDAAGGSEQIVHKTETETSEDGKPAKKAPK